MTTQFTQGPRRPILLAAAALTALCLPLAGPAWAEAGSNGGTNSGGANAGTYEFFQQEAARRERGDFATQTGSVTPRATAPEAEPGSRRNVRARRPR